MFAGKVSILNDMKKSFKALVPILVLLVYTVIGTVIFMAIEGPNELYEMEQLRQHREKLLEDTAFRLNTIKTMTPLQAYNHTVSSLVRYRDMLGVGEVRLNETKWNFWGSLYFSMTVYTTIGYGNMVPMTTTGRVLTIIYGFIGIPIALITLYFLGGLFARICMSVWKLMARSLGCFSKRLERKLTMLGPDEAVSNPESDSDSEELLQFPVAFLVAVTIFWVFFCAYIFLLWEKTWSYGLSLYFVIISFMTIGFGDVIPSKSNYILLVGFMLLVGLSLVSTMLTIIQKQITAVADDMKNNIDKDYQTALENLGQTRDSSIEPIDGRNGPDYEKNQRSVNDQEKPGLDSVVSRMPLKSRMLYHLLPDDRRKQLVKHVSKRHNIGVKWVQTDAWLMESQVPLNDNPNY